MKKEKIAVGGVYLVRFTTGLNVKARIVRELVEPDDRIPTKNDDAAREYQEAQYEVETLQRVGTHAKGHRFKVKARSIKKLVSLVGADTNGSDEDQDEQEATDLPRGRGPWGTLLPEDRAMREGGKDKPGIQVSLVVRLNNLTIDEVMPLMSVLEEYKPELLDLSKGG